MTNAVSISQPALVLYQAVVSKEPVSSPGGVEASDGLVFFSILDPSRISGLIKADGQLLSVSEHQALASVVGNAYGGDGDSFALPKLSGAAPIYITAGGSDPLWGQTQGNLGNETVLTHDQLPSALGGKSAPIDTEQFGIGVQYLIQVKGSYPTGYGGPTPGMLGMVHPYVGAAQDKVPDGFMPADGRLLNVHEYSALFSILGTTYGGDGRSTFALPDLRNRLPIGAGQMDNGQYVRVGHEVGSDSTALNNQSLAAGRGLVLEVLPPSIGMNYVVAVDRANTSFSADSPFVGQVMLFAGSRIPDGWVLADGRELASREYFGASLSLGTTFGGIPGETFNVPDLRGKTIVDVGGPHNLHLGQHVGRLNSLVQKGQLPEIEPPTPGVHLVDGDGKTIGNKITGQFEIDVSGAWPLATVEFSADGNTWSQNYQAQEGMNMLLVRQTTPFGFVSAASDPITFTLDTTAPEAPLVMVDGISAAAPMFKATNPSTPADGESIPRTSTGKLSFGNVEDGATLEFSIDGGQTWSDTFEAQAGLNQVQVRQVDAAGNVSAASELIQFHWDGSDTDPAITSISTHSTGGNLITVDQHGALAVGLGTDGIDLLVHGHQQDIMLPSDIEHIRLTENGLNNTVTGNTQDNVFEVIVGNWVIEGADGQDTVELANSIEDYVITQESYEGQPQATLYGPEGRIIVRDIETIQFTDATLTRAEGIEIAQIDHLYEEVLGRMPDPEGLTYWVNQMSQGATLTDVAQALSESTEFKQLYGTPSEEQLVEELYEAILNRAPDAQGLSHWVEELIVHDATEGELITSLLLSAESQDASTNQVSGGGLFVLG